MNPIVKYVILFISLGIGNTIYKLNISKPVVVPSEEWWGLGSSSKEDTSITPFKINIPDQALQDLQSRLKSARPFTPPLEGIQQQYGLNTKLLQEVVNYWRTKYNWREREQFLNQFPQYKTKIQGLNIHYLHVKPKNVPQGVKVVPLMLVHGWPGSIREFYEIIPKLITPVQGKNFVFEVIAPSLPGYGFSDPAVRPGLAIGQIAVIFKNLMKRLGHETFYLQGGDWGSAVVTHMSIFYPEIVKGVHLNMCMSNSNLYKFKLLVGSVWPSLVLSEKHAKKIYPLSQYISDLFLEFGYMHLQATKPDTVGVSLNDSPVGLAAYFLEKFITWTNPGFKELDHGGLLQKWTYDKLLDNIMIYWVTNSITTSMRLYSEAVVNSTTIHQVITIPSACSSFPHDVVYQPPEFFKDAYANLVHVAEHEDGGHFAAFEVPDVLADDIWTSVEKFRAFHAK